MPTYSYACTQCDNSFDIVQSFSDDTLTTCDSCGQRLRKLFNTVGVVFKGNGFYRTDSRSTNTSSSESAGSNSETTKTEASGATSSTSSTTTQSNSTPSTSTPSTS